MAPNTTIMMLITVARMGRESEISESVTDKEINGEKEGTAQGDGLWVGQDHPKHDRSKMVRLAGFFRLAGSNMCKSGQELAFLPLQSANDVQINLIHPNYACIDPACCPSLRDH